MCFDPTKGVDVVGGGLAGVEAAMQLARRDIPVETWIGHYDGAPTPENGMHVIWVETGEDGGSEDEENWIGYDGNNELRFLNHARLPNAEMDGLDLYAIHEISAGEEITINYGEEFETEVT